MADPYIQVSPSRELFKYIDLVDGILSYGISVLWQEAKKYTEPYIDRVAMVTKTHLDKLQERKCQCNSPCCKPGETQNYIFSANMTGNGSLTTLLERRHKTPFICADIMSTKLSIVPFEQW
ncbi:unnamed protein product [Malus baccata var. baccata]